MGIRRVRGIRKAVVVAVVRPSSSSSCRRQESVNHRAFVIVVVVVVYVGSRSCSRNHSARSARGSGKARPLRSAKRSSASFELRPRRQHHPFHHVAVTAARRGDRGQIHQERSDWRFHLSRNQPEGMLATWSTKCGWRYAARSNADFVSVSEAPGMHKFICEKCLPYARQDRKRELQQAMRRQGGEH